MAKSEIGNRIHGLYKDLERLKLTAENDNRHIRYFKKETKFKFNPYGFYYYSPPGPNYWDEECDLSYEQKEYAYIAFFKEALRVTEREIKKIKLQIKELQRQQSRGKQ